MTNGHHVKCDIELNSTFFPTKKKFNEYIFIICIHVLHPYMMRSFVFKAIIDKTGSAILILANLIKTRNIIFYSFNDVRI